MVLSDDHVKVASFHIIVDLLALLGPSKPKIKEKSFKPQGHINIDYQY